MFWENNSGHTGDEPEAKKAIRWLFANTAGQTWDIRWMQVWEFEQMRRQYVSYKVAAFFLVSFFETFQNYIPI